MSRWGFQDTDTIVGAEPDISIDIFLYVIDIIICQWLRIPFFMCQYGYRVL